MPPTAAEAAAASSTMQPVDAAEPSPAAATPTDAVELEEPEPATTSVLPPPPAEVAATVLAETATPELEPAAATPTAAAQPSPEQGGRPPPSRPPPGFIPAEAFAGLRPGYQFKMKGEHGRGYYPLFAPGPEPSQTATVPFEAADAFGGARPGYVFKMGDSGLGYYADGVSPADIARAAEVEAARAKELEGAAETRKLLEELSLAGGDMPALVALAKEQQRTELTAQLKQLGFKGLATRKKIEAGLMKVRFGYSAELRA
jgi:hypothetical protein